MRTRLRYPEGIFALQAAMYATYHMTNPAVFYNKEDLWEVPTMGAEPQPQVMQPYYAMMRLPGEAGAGVHPDAALHAGAQGQPRVVDGRAQRRRALRAPAASSSFPKQKVVFGPRQIVARINQDQAIAPQITLWNQQGSEVLQGTLLVIPIEESLIYIRPLYLRSAGGRIPELKRVIVAHQNQIVMEETLDKALERLFPPRAERRPRRQRPLAEPAPRTAPRRPPAHDRCRRGRASIISARSRRSGTATGRSTARRSAGSARCSNQMRRTP